MGAAGTDVVRALAHQPDGKLVAAGYTDAISGNDFAVARYDSAGVLDPSFGTGGRVTTDFGGGTDLGFAVALQPDGKILVAGRSLSGLGKLSFVVARYETNGSLDASFGTGGRVTTSFGSGSVDRGSAVAIQPDGMILVAGDTNRDGTTDFAVARYASNGAPDAGFGGGGVAVIGLGAGSIDFASSVAVQPDGRILVGGTSNVFSSNDFAVVRLLAAGTPDPGFGSGGITTKDFLVGSDDIGSALVLQSDGKIVMGGTTGDLGGQNGDFALARWNANGTPDTSFGGGTAAARTSFGGGSWDEAYGLALSGGKLLLAGFTTVGGNRDFALARFSTAGILDTTFGAGGTGRVTSPFGGASEETASAISISPWGRPVAAGSTTQNGTSDFALARYDAPCVPNISVSAPTAVCPSSQASASVADAGPGATYAWTAGNAFIVSGQGTRSVRFTAGASGAVSLAVTVQNGTCASNGGVSVPIDAVSCQSALSYYTLNPCRVFDTRPPGGTSLVAGSSRVFTVAGVCGVPADAKAVTANATVLYPTATGNLRFYANGAPTPSASVNAYTPGTTRANILQLSLGTNGEIRLDTVQPSGTADAILDVSGYFK